MLAASNVGPEAAPAIAPRPFYVVGHNPNTIAEVNAALDAGANAIEPDLNVYEDRPDEFCVSESGLLDPDEGGPASAPSLTEYLTELRQIALQRPELALVVFDCKPKAATPKRGAALLRAIRTLLTFDTNLNVILSVARRTEIDMFRDIAHSLGPREGGMIDEENDAAAVSRAFADAGVQNAAFGNGISVLNAILGPHVRPSMERACEFRAATAGLRFIYVWTVNDEDLMREYIRIGVDGIITGHPGSLRRILEECPFGDKVRIAVREDNPFLPDNSAYGLEILTSEDSEASPNANVSFTLSGAAGSASITVDATFPGRLECGRWDYATLPSADLGELRDITVQRDNAPDAPGWHLDRIQVISHRYGVAKLAAFDRWIDSASPITQPLA
jgi:glycerophosphoryl diester phosphodiesterase